MYRENDHGRGLLLARAAELEEIVENRLPDRYSHPVLVNVAVALGWRHGRDVGWRSPSGAPAPALRGPQTAAILVQTQGRLFEPWLHSVDAVLAEWEDQGIPVPPDLPSAPPRALAALLRAKAGRLPPPTPAPEHMTVGALRAFLAGHPDDHLVLVGHEGPGFVPVVGGSPLRVTAKPQEWCGWPVYEAAGPGEEGRPALFVGHPLAP